MNPQIQCRVLVLLLISALPVWSSQDLPPDVQKQAEQHVSAGNALFDKGAYTEAVKEYQQAIQMAPAWHEPYYELGSTYYQLQRLDEAQKQYELAIQRNPNCWLCYQGLGNLADDQNKPDAALQYYQTAIDLAPNRGRPRYNAAVTYFRMKRITEAISMLKDAERVEPQYASPYFLLGKIYYSQQKLYPAAEQLFQATKIEKSGSRFDEAKKLIDAQIVLDEKLGADASAGHTSYCLVRAGAILPEEYHKRFPNADTYVENLAEEEYVLGKVAKIVEEVSTSEKKPDPEFGRLVAISKAGYLAPWILSYSGERFADDRRDFEAKNPGRMDEFRKWASQSGISVEPIQPRCEVRWMGQTW